MFGSYSLPVASKSTGRAFVSTCCVAVFFAACSLGSAKAAKVSTSAPNPFRTGRTLVIPHGGGDGLYPENTMYAYEQTMAMGADVVDVDVRKSRDGVLVAFHDPTTTRITGQNRSVRSSTFAELAKLDAGWSFTKGNASPFRNKGIAIPSLESILKRFPKALLSLDLKDESVAMNAPLCRLLTRYRRTDDVFVGSNNDEQILHFRKQCPGVRTSATMVDVYASRDARAIDDPNFVPAVSVDQPPFRMGGRTLVDKESLDWAHGHGVAILTWVVNDTKSLEHLVDIGVDGIYTSYPDRLLKILGRSSAPKS
jgi:glycerophosphoryl diester phosphodiesterase